jgi:hypothetical protein
MGKSATGVSSDVTAAETSNSNALTAIAQQQNQNSQTLFNESNPGFQTAENQYATLASGNPYAISRAVAPQVQQISQATAGAKQNIMNNAPAGGEKAIALESADVAQGAKVGDVSTGAIGGSFNALAQLAGQGTGESNASANTAISGLGTSNSGFGQIGQQQIQQQQLQAQQKGQSLSAFGGLGGDVAGMIGDTATAGGATGLAALFAM